MKSARLCVALLVASVAQTGTAWAYDYDFLDKLSGPGPFTGYYFDYRFACFSRLSAQGPLRKDEKDPTKDEKDVVFTTFLSPIARSAGLAPFKSVPALPRPDPTAANPEAELQRVRRGTAKTHCHGDKNVSAFLAVAYGYSSSKKNNLFPADEHNPRYGVNIHTWELIYGSRVHRSVDVTTGVGFSSFTGDAFSTFNRMVLTLGSIDWAPLAMTQDTQKSRAIRLSVGVIMFVPGFNTGDFCNPDSGCLGARPFESKGEVIPRFTLKVDPVVFWP